MRVTVPTVKDNRMRIRDPHRRLIAARLVERRADNPADLDHELDRGRHCTCGHRKGWHLDEMWCTVCVDCHELGGYTPAPLDGPTLRPRDLGLPSRFLLD